jgi:hypothetical protein
MKKIFNVFFVLAMVTAMIFFHAVTIKAQGAYSSEEKAPIQKTASLQEPASQETSSIKIVRSAICTDVVEREPMEVGESFNSSVGKLFCFTKIVGAKTPVEVTHAWYFDDTEMATVNLPVRSPNWRTYSSKIILTREVGDWHVDVIGPDGEVLKTLEFTITQ